MRSNQLSYRAIALSGIVVSRLRVQKYDIFLLHQTFVPKNFVSFIQLSEVP